MNPPRRASERDASAIAELTNAAYVVEQFFIDGDRTTVAEVAELMSRGHFLVIDADAGRLAGSVHVRIDGDRGYFGLLAVDPARHGQGLGRRLVAAAEATCAAAGCSFMDLRVVNLRSELPPWYRSLGYEECGTEPFPEEAGPKLPCHFIRMSKPLAQSLAGGS